MPKPLLSWSEDKPNKEGFYWVCLKGESKGQLVHSSSIGNGYGFLFAGPVPVIMPPNPLTGMGGHQGITREEYLARRSANA